MVELNESERALRVALDELLAASQVRVFSSERGSIFDGPELEEVLRSIAPHHGAEFLRVLRSSSIRLDRISCHWRIETEGFELNGEFRVRHLGAALDSDAPETDWEAEELDDEDEPDGEFDGDVEPDEDFCSELRVIDDHPGSGTGVFTALRVPADGGVCEVWYEDFRRGMFKLDIDYGGYLEALAVTKGVTGWPLLFADVSFRDPDFTGIGKGLDRAVGVLRGLFPQYDYGFFEERLREREG